MTYQEFCGEYCSTVMHRFSELIQFMPKLYEIFCEENTDAEEFAIRSFCGPYYEEPKKKQLRASDYRQMLPEDRKDLFDQLCDIRYEHSRSENVPAYIIRASGTFLASSCVAMLKQPADYLQNP